MTARAYLDRMTLEERFEAANEEHHKFDRIPKRDRPSRRADLCAFIRLDKLVPEPAAGYGADSIISCSEHEVIYFGIDPETLNKVATDEDILYLVRCGVWYDSELDSLSMFT